jgi:hypothetical protein
MGNNGGARAGAGRKPKVVRHARMIAKVEKLIADGLPKRIATLEALSDGILCQRETADGPKVYEVPPDRQANIFLVERIMGKAQESVDHTTDGDKLPSAPTIIEVRMNRPKKDG